MKRLSRCTMALAVSLLIVLPKKVAQGCGFYVWPGYYRFWLLQPDLTNQKDLSPFFFATTYIYPGESPAENRPFHYDQNIQEWRELVGKTATVKDIDAILYQTEPDTFLQHFEKLVKENSFARQLQLPKNKELLKYMQLSKKIETLTVNPDPWYENRYTDPAFDRLISEASALYTTTASPVIRLRIAYQLIRLYGYFGETKLLNKTYREKVAGVRSDSWIKAAAQYEQAIHAGFPEDDYLCSRVFDQTGYNRSYCLIRFRSNALEKTLAFATNEHERTVLYAMRMFNDPGKTLRNLKFIYNREPDYKELVFLLLREVNKTEDWLLTSKVTDFGPAMESWAVIRKESVPSNYERDKAYAIELREFVKQVIKEGKNKDRALLHICAAHLSFMLRDNAASRQYLDKASRLPNLPANVKTQLRIDDLLLSLETDPAFSNETEEKLMGLLSASNKKLGLHDPTVMKDQLILYTGKKLISKGQKAKGFLLLAKTGRIFGETAVGYKSIYEEIWEKAIPSDYDEMFQLMDKEQKNAFEDFVTKGHLRSAWAYYQLDRNQDSMRWDRNRLLNLKAGWYIQQDSLEKAATVLKQIPAAFWKKYPFADYIQGDPFYLDMYQPYAVTTGERSYNKPQIIDNMLQLKKKITEDKSKAALYYYKLGNAYYNMTYHGKHWLMSKPWWSATETGEYDTYAKASDFNNNYYGCERAKQYYLMALRETSDKKLASLCVLMAGKCQENNQEYLLALQKKWSNSRNPRNPNPYMTLLKQKNMNTTYYKELIEECATYASFINRLNKQY
jgi:hypothetical protein